MNEMRRGEYLVLLESIMRPITGDSTRQGLTVNTHLHIIKGTLGKCLQMEGKNSMRMHIFVNPATKQVIEEIHQRFGMPKGEVARRMLDFAMRHMKERDWTQRPRKAALARGPGRPR